MKLLSIAYLLSTAIGYALTVTRHRQVQCDINEEDAKAFLKCLNECSEDYNVIVDEVGYLVIHPRDRRELDPTALDAALYKCIRLSTNKLSMAAHDSKFDDDYTRRSSKLEDVTFQQLQSDGWKGMTAVEYEDGYSSSMGKGQIYRFASPSYSSEASGQDRILSYLNNLHGYRKPLAGFIGQNK